MKRHTPIRLARQRWKLSQDELATLAGTTQSIVSRLETDEAVPDLALAFRLQAIFGCSPRALFPAHYDVNVDRAMAGAAAVDRTLGARTDHATQTKRRLLTAMLYRATPNTERA